MEEKGVLRTARSFAPPSPPYPGTRDEDEKMLTDVEYSLLRNAFAKIVLVDSLLAKFIVVEGGGQATVWPCRHKPAEVTQKVHQVNSNAPCVAARKRSLAFEGAVDVLLKSEEAHDSGGSYEEGSSWWTKRQSRASGSGSWQSSWGSHDKRWQDC